MGKAGGHYAKPWNVRVVGAEVDAGELLARHAEVLWAAEEENSRRHNARRRLLISLATGEITISLVAASSLLGEEPLGEYLEWIGRQSDPGFYLAMAVFGLSFLLIAVVLALRAIVVATGETKLTREDEDRILARYGAGLSATGDGEFLESGATASWNLVLTPEVLTSLAERIDELTLEPISHRYEAGVRLLARNRWQSDWLDRATKHMHASAMVLAAAAFVWFVPIALATMIGYSSGEIRYEKEAAQQTSSDRGWPEADGEDVGAQ